MAYVDYLNGSLKVSINHFNFNKFVFCFDFLFDLNKTFSHLPNHFFQGFVRFQNAEECKKIKQLKDKENWKFKIEKLKGWLFFFFGFQFSS